MSIRNKRLLVLLDQQKKFFERVTPTTWLVDKNPIPLEVMGADLDELWTLYDEIRAEAEDIGHVIETK